MTTLMRKPRKKTPPLMNKIFMKEALIEAHKAKVLGEVPVGAIIVKDGEIIARGNNLRETKQNALSHAEIECINEACKNLGTWRLEGCEMYVTLEPCPMCTGAIINSRISTVIFGAYDLKMGCMDSVINLCDYPFNHHPAVEKGVLAEESRQILSAYFKNKREK